ncbi:hypothetical protein niasHS_005628 [Heterodera schachtii]|uniref:Uncharacterized protein n=1 Tax=Heterodera schachtii TaxID=97005 RepID=A0ABD2JZ62_HETSC
MAEEERKNYEKLCDLAEKLQVKIRAQKKLLDDTEEKANISLQKYRQFQSSVYNAEERANTAESSLARMRSWSQTGRAQRQRTVGQFHLITAIPSLLSIRFFPNLLLFSAVACDSKVSFSWQLIIILIQQLCWMSLRYMKQHMCWPCGSLHLEKECKRWPIRLEGAKQWSLKISLNYLVHLQTMRTHQGTDLNDAVTAPPSN